MIFLDGCLGGGEWRDNREDLRDVKMWTVVARKGHLAECGRSMGNACPGGGQPGEQRQGWWGGGGSPAEALLRPALECELSYSPGLCSTHGARKGGPLTGGLCLKWIMGLFNFHDACVCVCVCLHYEETEAQVISDRPVWLRVPVPTHIVYCLQSQALFYPPFVL